MGHHPISDDIGQLGSTAGSVSFSFRPAPPCPERGGSDRALPAEAEIPKPPAPSGRPRTWRNLLFAGAAWAAIWALAAGLRARGDLAEIV